VTIAISVLIPTLNAGSSLAGSLRSLAKQTARDFEVLVLDGASSDDTLVVAESFRSVLPQLVVSCQNDGGVYQAINRGIAIARGSWIYVLGSDDELSDECVLKHIGQILHCTNAWLVYGDVRMSTTNPWVPAGDRYAGPVDLSFLTERNICQQAIFYRKEIFDRMGTFRTKYKICADWDFALRSVAAGLSEWVDLVICNYAATGLSSRTPDRQFQHDRPWRILRIVSQRPFATEVRAFRWWLHSIGRIRWTRGEFACGLVCWLGWAWLSTLTKLVQKLQSQAR
jgi:glycosyltransferase involved in cell wall biosynthesis